MRYDPADGLWEVRRSTGLGLARDCFSDANFEEARRALKLLLCDYFSDGDCTNAMGKSIRPMGATAKGGKILKVRWALPGAGKRGGLRMAVVVYCKARRVVIADAFVRKDDPTDEEFLAAVAGF